MSFGLLSGRTVTTSMIDIYLDYVKQINYNGYIVDHFHCNKKDAATNGNIHQLKIFKGLSLNKLSSTQLNGIRM